MKKLSKKAFTEAYLNPAFEQADRWADRPEDEKEVIKLIRGPINAMYVRRSRLEVINPSILFPPEDFLCFYGVHNAIQFLRENDLLQYAPDLYHESEDRTTAADLLDFGMTDDAQFFQRQARLSLVRRLKDEAPAALVREIYRVAGV